MLRRKLSEPEAVCLKEVVIFTPCLLLEGDIELVSHQHHLLPPPSHMLSSCCMLVLRLTARLALLET